MMLLLNIIFLSKLSKSENFIIIFLFCVIALCIITQFKYSPLEFLNKVKTPILFIMGNPELGGADTYGTVKKYYNALKEKNIDTEYIYIDNEGHNFYKKKNIKKIFKKVYFWINKYLK